MIARAVDPIIPATITRLKKQSQIQWTRPFVATPTDRSSPSNGLVTFTDSDPNSNHIPVLGSWDENLNPSPCSSACRSGTVNSKSFVGKDFLRIKWKFKLNTTL